MSVYVGIDVHGKRSQVAAVDEGGEVMCNRNVPNGVETILSVTGDLPSLPDRNVHAGHVQPRSLTRQGAPCTHAHPARSGPASASSLARPKSPRSGGSIRPVGMHPDLFIGASPLPNCCSSAIG
jgi:hypothetical protein